MPMSQNEWLAWPYIITCQSIFASVSSASSASIIARGVTGSAEPWNTNTGPWKSGVASSSTGWGRVTWNTTVPG